MSKTNRLLVVDDEEVIRDLCSEILSRQGYTVDTAENGMAALKKVEKNTYDVVLVDFNMPLMNGLELLETVKRDLPHIEVIIMTAFGTIQNAIEAMRKGAYDFVLKPFNADQIQVVVKKCIDKIELGKENKELRKVNQKLRDIQEMKDKFIAITSHELRTPLSHVKGYIGILNDEIAETIPEEEKSEFWNIIYAAIEQLEHIVTNMYSIARIDNGTLRIDRSKFDLNDLMMQLVNEYKLTLKKRDQKLILNLTEQVREYYGDRMRVKQMCNALIDNAIKYTQDGGKIEINTECKDKHCIIEVNDNGIGIPKDELGKIFEKFYEVQNSDHHTTSRSDFMGGGMGLGLSIAKAIAEAHGGGIKVDSKENRGSSFQIYLPLASQEIKIESRN